MTSNQISKIFVIAFTILGCIFLGAGTNMLVGTGAFFLMWALAGLLETT